MKFSCDVIAGVYDDAVGQLISWFWLLSVCCSFILGLKLSVL